jgi:hypothetical protein
VYVEYEKMMHLMAKALSDGEPVADVLYVACQETLKKELGNDVDSGALLVYDPLTRGRHSCPIGDALRTALVRVADFRTIAVARAIEVIVETKNEPTEADKAALRVRIEKDEAFRRSLDHLSPNARRIALDAAGMHRVSSAPRPITPIVGSVVYTAKPAPSPIDWSHWKLMLEVPLWEAVALSVNINPKGLRFDTAGEGFENRLRIALSHASAKKLDLVARLAELNKSPVLLASFAAWAVGIGFPDMPPEFVALATAPLGMPNNDILAVVTPMASASALEPTAHQAALVEPLDAICAVDSIAKDNLNTELNLPWWQTSHDIHEMWQNIGATFHSQSKRTSNSAIAIEIEKRINGIEKSKGRDRVAPDHDTIRGLFTGRKWKPI